MLQSPNQIASFAGSVDSGGTGTRHFSRLLCPICGRVIFLGRRLVSPGKQTEIPRRTNVKQLRLSLIATLAALPLLFGGLAAKAADIVDTAVEAGQFKTLVAAVEAAELVETLKGDGPFTVFAPTDEAFAKLPEGTVENLLKPENKDQLVAILTYHVVPGKIMSGDIAGKTADVETVQGGKLAVDAMDGVKVDDAQVITADIETSNGVIHVIDTVVLPK
ncbi:fasciclin domain-containing protein [Denitrobaculum tricleocarpae]|uniref:Fasciclin domain-containing protein n=1 Tax=Denitrobaculum tricleocarpae TaxID=2591009 RepID=A0A545TGG4_9PROT|nr:fasciclin domain-containing protein [Denitrobaculum tricleocarpae]